ncbi:MAG: hypothetical protein AAF355_04680 [Myxococcota bacterium]
MIQVRVGELAGTLETLEGEVVTLRLDGSVAPGAPKTMIALLEDGALELQGKCVGGRRHGEGVFVVQFRLTNLRRQVRKTLSDALKI